MQPDLSFPEDMREFVVTRSWYWRVGLKSRVSFLLLFSVLFFALMLSVELVTNARMVIAYPWVYLRNSLPVYGVLMLFYAVVILCLMYNQARKTKYLDRVMFFGFTEKAFFTRSAFFESAIRWEYCNAWKETIESFYLHDATRWVLFPKAIWSVAELETIRGLLRRKVTLTSMPD